MPGKGQADGSTAAYNGLPEELAEFLSRDTYSLLIKGGSGTGKTILALTILKALVPIENPLYISTRTSPLQLVENFPWVEEVLGAEAGSGGGKESEGWETLVDARLDEPNVVFERITNVLMDRQAPTVVIDSWESLSDTLGSDALRTNIRVLQTWRERAGARFIFIGEDPENTAIDFMVEGVIVLKDKVSDGRRARELVISKLHGIQIARPSYFFTLNGGGFMSLPSYSPHDYGFRSPLPVTFDRPFRKLKSKFPTCYAPLDAQLDGGFPARSTAILEVDRRVDPKVGLIFLSRLVQDWLIAGDRVVLERPRDVDLSYLNQFLKSFAGASRDRVAVLGGSRRRGHPLTGAKGGKQQKAKTLAIIAAKDADQRRELLPGGEGGTDLAVVVGRPNDLPEALVREASVHLKIIDIEGTLFVESEVPWSPLFAIVPRMTGGNPMIQLEPMV